MLECRALNPCCVGDRGMCGLIVLKISLSRIFTRLHNEEIVSSVGILLGLSMGMILPIFPDVWNVVVPLYLTSAPVTDLD